MPTNINSQESASGKKQQTPMSASTSTQEPIGITAAAVAAATTAATFQNPLTTTAAAATASVSQDIVKMISESQESSPPLLTIKVSKEAPPVITEPPDLSAQEIMLESPTSPSPSSDEEDLGPGFIDEVARRRYNEFQYCKGQLECAIVNVESHHASGMQLCMDYRREPIPEDIRRQELM